jgi:hypothetical protein
MTKLRGFGAVFSLLLWITLLIMIFKKRNKINKSFINFGHHFYFKIIINNWFVRIVK